MKAGKYLDKFQIHNPMPFSQMIWWTALLSQNSSYYQANIWEVVFQTEDASDLTLVTLIMLALILCKKTSLTEWWRRYIFITYTVIVQCDSTLSHTRIQVQFTFICHILWLWMGFISYSKGNPIQASIGCLISTKQHYTYSI